MSGFSHFDEKGGAIMVDVADKPETERLAIAATYKNSRDADPVPHAVTSLRPALRASTNLRISAGITCEDCRSKLSRGP